MLTGRISRAAMTRRQLLQSGVAAGIAFQLSCLGSSTRAAQIESASDDALSVFDDKGRLRHRVDALAKVTGEKSFSRDFRARDLPGWPSEQSHAFMIHATLADRTFEGVDLSALGNDLQPDRLVTADDLARDKIRPHRRPFYGEYFLVPKGQTPQVLGQPVALLIYKDFARFAAAKRRLRFNDKVVQYGAITGPKSPAHYGTARFVRVQNDLPDPNGVYAPTIDATIFGKFDGDQSVWPAPDPAGAPPAKAMAAAADIAKEIAAAKSAPNSFVLQRDYYSQSIDASAMEADNGNVWYDAANGTLHMLVSTQSPYEVATGAARLLADTNFKIGKIDLTIGHTVGYGTKDQSVFPYYCLMAGLYGDGRPVRLANDRFEQFQVGMKQHPFWMKNTLVADKATGKFKIIKGEYKMDGGGRPNVSNTVGIAGTSQALSIYHVPKSDLYFAALASRAVEAGSTRGYGSLQTIMGIEMLVDEAADALGIDAIEIRERNLSTVGTKVPDDEPMVRNAEILQKAKVHPVWTQRKARKAEFDKNNPGRKYGVGFSLVQRGYGNLAQSAFASLSFDADGKLSLRQIGNEIGVGTTTSQLVMVKDIIGVVPEKTQFGVVAWPELPLTTTEGATPDKELELQTNPRWTPMITSPMSASNGAYFIGHATREAARTLVRLGLQPTAIAMWARSDASPVALADIRLINGMLTAPGRPPLPLDKVMAAAHELGNITGVSVHVFNRKRAQWAQADFDVPTIGQVKLQADALAVQYGKGAPEDRRALLTTGGFHFVERSKVYYAPMRNVVGMNYISSIANIVEVAVNTATGEVDMLAHHSILECGTQVVPELVSGQLQGGLAMGIGHALHEDMPLYEDGPGDGTWNWNRYHIPRASDVAVWAQTAEVLPARSEKDPIKGMAEVIVIGIIPATANAVANAIGHRFYDMPITPDRIRGVLS